MNTETGNLNLILSAVNYLPDITRRRFLGWLGILGATAFSGPAGGSSKSDQLITRPIPSSGEQLPAIGLGTWQTFDETLNSETRKRLKQVLTNMYDMGGTVIDSSPMYGRAETIVGELTEELGLNQKLFLATKVWSTGKNAGVEQMNTSLRLMNRTQMDLMQIHNLVDWETHLKTLQDWKESGKIRYLGVTHYATSAFSRIEKLMQTEKLDFIQIPFSLELRQAEDRMLPLARDTQTAVLINRPYEGGSLFRRVRGKDLPDWAREIDCQSWGQFFLKYILGHPAVTCVIPGTGDPKHITDNMQAAFGRLPDSSLRKRMVEYFETL